MNIKDYKPGMVIEVPGFVMHGSWSDTATFHEREMPESGYTTICTHTLRFCVPSGFNATAAEIAGIDAALDKAADAYHSTVSQLKERKAALLQIGCSQGDTSVVDADESQEFKEIPLVDDGEPF